MRPAACDLIFHCYQIVSVMYEYSQQKLSMPACFSRRGEAEQNRQVNSQKHGRSLPLPASHPASHRIRMSPVSQHRQRIVREAIRPTAGLVHACPAPRDSTVHARARFPMLQSAVKSLWLPASLDAMPAHRPGCLMLAVTRRFAASTSPSAGDFPTCLPAFPQQAPT